MPLMYYPIMDFHTASSLIKTPVLHQFSLENFATLWELHRTSVRHTTLKLMASWRQRNQLQFLIHWKGFSEAHDSWEPAKDVHADELVEEFYKRHPLAICSISSPLIICSINMSTTPLSERIEDAPAPLSLADHLSSPSPSLHTSPITEELPLVPINTRPPS